MVQMQHVLEWKEPCLALQQSMWMLPRSQAVIGVFTHPILLKYINGEHVSWEAC